MRRALAATGLLLAAVPVAAQLTSASVSTLGLAGNDTAIVRGFGAISVNPAGLAMPGSEFSWRCCRCGRPPRSVRSP